MTDTIRVNGAPVEHMDEDEITQLHERLALRALDWPHRACVRRGNQRGVRFLCADHRA